MSNWRKSTWSGTQADCVEVGSDDSIMVRDTKNRKGVSLEFTPSAWKGFLSQVRSGSALKTVETV